MPRISASTDKSIKSHGDWTYIHAPLGNNDTKQA